MVDGEYKLYNIHSIIISPATLQIMLLQRPLLMLLCLHHHHCNFLFATDSKKFILYENLLRQLRPRCPLLTRKVFIHDHDTFTLWNSLLSLIVLLWRQVLFFTRVENIWKSEGQSWYLCVFCWNKKFDKKLKEWPVSLFCPVFRFSWQCAKKYRGTEWAVFPLSLSSSSRHLLS